MTRWNVVARELTCFVMMLVLTVLIQLLIVMSAHSQMFPSPGPGHASYGGGAPSAAGSFLADGSGEGAYLATYFPMTATTWTVCAKVYRTSIVDWSTMLCGVTAGASNDDRVYMPSQYDAGGNVTRWYNNGSQSWQENASGAFHTSEWQEICLARASGGTCIGYVNGVAYNTASSCAVATSARTYTLFGGNDDAAGFVIGGKMSEIRLFTDTKDATYLAAHYNCVLKTDTANLWGYWRMTEGSGTTINDETANNRDATFQGSTTWDTGPTLNNANSGAGTTGADCRAW